MPPNLSFFLKDAKTLSKKFEFKSVYSTHNLPKNLKEGSNILNFNGYNKRWVHGIVYYVKNG